VIDHNAVNLFCQLFVAVNQSRRYVEANGFEPTRDCAGATIQMSSTGIENGRVRVPLHVGFQRLRCLYSLEHVLLLRAGAAVVLRGGVGDAARQLWVLCADGVCRAFGGTMMCKRAR
jgi:hypothetical protein